jgi:hypothetical protein
VYPTTKPSSIDFFQALPKTLKGLWLSENELTEILEKAFESLLNLSLLVMLKNSLKSFVISDSKLQNQSILSWQHKWQSRITSTSQEQLDNSFRCNVSKSCHDR